MESKNIEPLDIIAYQQKKCSWSLNADKDSDPHYHSKP
jgi:hypothetical protein